MILIIGVLEDPVIRLVCAALLVEEVEFRFCDQRKFLTTDSLVMTGGGVDGFETGLRGHFSIRGELVDLQDIRAVFARPLGPVEDSKEDTGLSPSSTAVLELLLEQLPCLVINRSGAHGSNLAKPFQYPFIRESQFAIPDTLITNSERRTWDFYSDHPSGTIYKSVSSIRSEVQLLQGRTTREVSKDDDLAACPVQLQALVEGVDVRVHVVDDTCYARMIHSEAVDYRYEGEGQALTRTSPMSLPIDVSASCVRLTRTLGLTLAGIDLRRGEGGAAWTCFEVNTMPFFAYYEDESFRITAALVRVLRREGDGDRGRPPSVPGYDRASARPQSGLSVYSCVASGRLNPPLIGAHLRPQIALYDYAEASNTGDLPQVLQPEIRSYAFRQLG